MPDEKPTPETAPVASVPEPETKPVTAAEIVAPLGERMPPVTESSPVNDPKPEISASTSPDLRDSRGMRFNSFRHQANPDGSPRKNNKGNFMLKNEYRLGRLRPDGTAAQTASVSTGQPSFAEPSRASEIHAGPVPDQYDASAEVYLQAAVGPLVIALGNDIRPDVDDHAALKASIANYLRSTGATELSPGWALTITIAAFAAKKAGVPTVQERALTLWEKTKALFGKKPKPVATA